MSHAPPPKGGHAIVTGGSSGIGLAVCRRLAKRGMAVTLIARDEPRLEQAYLEVMAHQSDSAKPVQAFAADVADEQALAAAIEGSIAVAGPPTLLITSAGIAVPGYFADLPKGIFRETMDINYFGTLHAVHAALPAMKAGGRIVMISSGAGLIGLFGYAAYSPSKFALRGLAEALDAELRHQGVRVSICFPPDTDTPQLAFENKTKPAETKMMTGGATMMTADAVADAILRGIDSGHFSICPGWEMAALNRLAGIAAPILQWWWAIKTAKMARRR